jgi:uncharacterized protein
MSHRSPPLTEIRHLAHSYFTDAVSPAHDWRHVQRVESLADRLLADHESADARTVRTAVLLHDIGRAREARGEIDDHATWGARETRDLLRARGQDRERIDAVCHAIRVHRYSNEHEPETLEAELLCDADNLDALGAVGIARCFTEGGVRGHDMHGPDLAAGASGTGPHDRVGSAQGTQYGHFHEKILELPARMYTDTGHRLATERAAYVREFLGRFEREVAGEL